MGGKRQKNQLYLAFMTESRGEAPRAVVGGTDPSMAGRVTESPVSIERLMGPSPLESFEGHITLRTAVYEPVRTVV